MLKRKKISKEIKKDNNLPPNRIIITKYDLSYKSRENKQIKSGSDLKKLLLSDNLTSNDRTTECSSSSDIQNENNGLYKNENSSSNLIDLNQKKNFNYKEFVNKVLKSSPVL